MLFNNKLFNSIACLLSFTNLQLVIPGRTWILLYLGRTVYKRLWAYLALYIEEIIKLELLKIGYQLSLGTLPINLSRDLKRDHLSNSLRNITMTLVISKTCIFLKLKGKLTEIVFYTSAFLNTTICLKA